MTGSRLFLDIYLKSRNSSLYNNAFYLMLNTLSTSLLGFVFWNVMTRFFVPTQVGIGSALVSASSLVGILTGLGLRIGLIRFVPEIRERAVLLINASFTLVGLVSLIGAITYLAGIKYWSPALEFVRENIVFLLLFMFFTVVNALSVLIDGSLIAGRDAKYVFWKNTITSILKMPLPILIFAHLKGFGIFAGVGTGIAVGVFIAWLFFLPKVYKGYFPRPAIAKDIMQKVLPYSFANYTANLLNLSPKYIYPLMVLNILGPENSAYFYIAWMMSMVLSIIPSGISQSLLAEGSHNPKKMGRDGRKVLLLSLGMSIPAVVSMMLFGGWLLHFFGPGYAENGTTVMRYLVLAMIPQCINTLFITINQVKKQTYLIIAQTSFLAIVSLGVAYWLLGRVGLPGIGIAYLTAHMFLSLVIIRPLWIALKEKSYAPSAKI
ncbi:Membrane protein involved in the export of O-antigen and teichoic acid [Desulfotomaculum arcticum]|uniref:Membrane protein involved in the export of O-antigen and teichoic acid n=1 Tax=Desulfotruncus arcticus DSM 17038 TaxID=1121424 RepID=A0A1I2QA03_9FIRM|nr:Membrane protein involved in the export of O-antigen and teichoic acid [Desulfotomaculum arcticum] [Desulfotruncus arcticus DSM 17038]